MYLLNLEESVKSLHHRIEFTFHYVSIKSKKHFDVDAFLIYLHSTMYLLNPIRDNRGTMFFTNLHSTMYLLNQSRAMINVQAKYNLHSTMYLLNHIHSRGQPLL